MQVCLLSFRTRSCCGWRGDRPFSVVGVEDRALCGRGQMYILLQVCNVWIWILFDLCSCCILVCIV